MGAAAFILLLGAGFGTGLLIARKRGAAIVAALCAAGILARLLLRLFPLLENRLFDEPWYPRVQFGWALPLGMLLLGIGIRRMKPIGWRALAGAAAAVIFFLGTDWALCLNCPSVLTGVPDSFGVCYQTATYSCGPAAAATFLAQMGVYASESEMASLCAATPIGGTTEVALRHALERKLEPMGLSVRLMKPSWESLSRSDKPILARLRSGWRDHWVVVLAMNDRTVMLADPLQGRVEMAAEEFRAAWRGIVFRSDYPHRLASM